MKFVLQVKFHFSCAGKWRLCYRVNQESQVQDFLSDAHGCTMFLGACRSHVFMALSTYFAFDLLPSFVCVLFCEAYLFFTEKMVLGTPMMY